MIRYKYPITIFASFFIRLNDGVDYAFVLGLTSFSNIPLWLWNWEILILGGQYLYQLFQFCLRRYIFFLKNNLESVTKSVTLNLRKKCNVSEVLILCGLLEGKMAGGQGFEPW